MAHKMIALEPFILYNFAMNAALLSGVAYVHGRRPGKGVLAGAALGTAYAVADVLLPGAGLHSAWAIPLSGGALAILAAGARNPGRAVSALIALLLLSALAAGVMELTRRTFRAPLIPMLLSAAGVLTMARGVGGMRDLRSGAATGPDARDSFQRRMRLTTEYGCAEFTALVDTGNRLTEPVSGQPVMVVAEGAALSALPAGFDAREAAVRPPAGFRLVRYGGLGGEGYMACFRPRTLYEGGGRDAYARDSAYAEGGGCARGGSHADVGEQSRGDAYANGDVYSQGNTHAGGGAPSKPRVHSTPWRSVPGIWVAIYPGALPGGTQALAPWSMAAAYGASPRSARLRQGRRGIARRARRGPGQGA